MKGSTWAADPAVPSRSPAEPLATPVQGRARLGRKTKALVQRLGPDDIAVIDHADIDRIAAEDLAAVITEAGRKREALVLWGGHNPFGVPFFIHGRDQFWGVDRVAPVTDGGPGPWLAEQSTSALSG